MSKEKISKYSSILMAVPIGSFTLINPEKIKRPPTRYRVIFVAAFIVLLFLNQS
jgi:hypothetical protein